MASSCNKGICEGEEGFIDLWQQLSHRLQIRLQIYGCLDESDNVCTGGRTLFQLSVSHVSLVNYCS